MFVGLPSVLYDKDVRRRSLYGKAGSFRLQPWGVEARNLSGAMYANEKLMRIVWNGIIQAIDAYNHGRVLPNPNDVRKAIDESNVELAKALITKYRINITEY